MEQRAGGGLEHIAYEMVVLHHLFERVWINRANVLDKVNGMDAQIVENGLMEATLVHLRNVADFFEASKQKPRPAGMRPCKNDDIISEDYDFPARLMPIPNETRERINKEISHLTYVRVGITPEKKIWVFAPLLTPIFPHCREFAIHIRKNFPSLIDPITDPRILYLELLETRPAPAVQVFTANTAAQFSQVVMIRPKPTA